MEDRKLLAGVVNIEIDPVVAAGTINLVGDSSNNSVIIRQTVNPNEYVITRPVGDSTLFQLNGAGVTQPSFTVNAINGDIEVNLGDGNDRFEFLGVSAGSTRSHAHQDLIINNEDGSNVNVIQDVIIHGDLSVMKDAASSGYSELSIISSQVNGYTTIDNVGTGGDTKTFISNVNLQGGAAASVLSILNGNGADLIDIQGNTQIGTGGFIGAQPIVSIDNGDGGSRTTFTGASNVAGSGTTTIYGDVNINNGDNIFGIMDVVTFNQVNVLGEVDVDNNDGMSQVLVDGSDIGSHRAAGLGGKLEVQNGIGIDRFEMNDSNAQYGVEIDNGTGVWGSDTSISGGSIGTHASVAGTALEIINDNGNDVVNISGTTFGAGVDLDSMGNGMNAITISDDASMPMLVIRGGNEDDDVTINNSTITDDVDIQLGLGQDSLIIIDVDPSTQWPSALLGSIVLDGGDGVDESNLNALALGALDFELIV
ncbi:MAG: hypothetical protein R3C05_07745 [Pirellulaceae bacterium]